MSRVECHVGYVELENDSGQPIDSVTVTCSRCDHTATAYGQHGRSIRRCCVELNQTCPEAQENFYQVAE